MSDPLGNIRKFLGKTVCSNGDYVTTIHIQFPKKYRLPELFESAVNTNPERKYRNREDAIAGHKKLVEERGGEKKEDDNVRL